MANLLPQRHPSSLAPFVLFVPGGDSDSVSEVAESDERKVLS